MDRGVPEVWGSVYDVRDLLDSSVKLMDGKSPLEISLPGPLNAVKKALIKGVKGTAVSYTPLDVYKRQADTSGVFHCHACLQRLDQSGDRPAYGIVG